MERPYQICTRCIMDTTDPDISFDTDGVCSHCHFYDDTMKSKSYRRKRERGELDRLVYKIKNAGRGKSYDCIIGVSGGVDSTYTAYIVKKIGLRPLAVHLDNGWDSEPAVRNIELTLDKLKIDLYTHVLDWEAFRNLQLAFLKCSSPDSEIPTDHAILAILYQVAAHERVRYILSGHNTATECGGVAAWSQGHGDWKYIKSVNKQFGGKSLNNFPYYGPWKFIYYTLVKRIQWIQILDYFNYYKKEALNLLQSELGWKYYGGKHYESIYTRFYQGYILPRKFGFIKKRLHLSSLIWSDQLSREEALSEMEKIDYSIELQNEDKEFVIKKLEISSREFEEIMLRPPLTFWDYPSYKKMFRSKRLLSMYHALKRS